MTGSDFERESLLLNAFSYIDEKYIEEASPERDEDKQTRWYTDSPAPPAKRRSTWLQYAAAAAAISLAVAAAAMLLPKDTGDNISTDNPPVAAEHLSFTLYAEPSGLYRFLPELAEHLKLFGKPDDGTAYSFGGKVIASVDVSENGTDAARQGVFGGRAADVSGQYAYIIGKNAVNIVRSDGSGSENAGRIDIAADGVFVKDNSLIVLSHAPASPEHHDGTTLISVYDISAPDAPVLADRYEQSGKYIASRINGGELLFVTGGSGDVFFGSVTDCYPSLSQNGKAVAWDDSDVTILGEPAALRYTAVTVIGVTNGGIVKKEALYGDIQRLFIGADWLAASDAGEGSAYRDNPVLYTFDRDLNYKSTIDISEILGISGSNKLVNHEPKSGDLLSVLSVRKYGDVFRLIGTLTTLDNGVRKESFIAIAADTRTGEAGMVQIPADAFSYGASVRVQWEDDRVVVYVDDSIDGNGGYFVVNFGDLGIEDNSDETTTAATTTGTTAETEPAVSPSDDKTTTTAGTTAHNKTNKTTEPSIGGGGQTDPPPPPPPNPDEGEEHPV